MTPEKHVEITLDKAEELLRRAQDGCKGRLEQTELEALYRDIATFLGQ